MTKIDHEGSRGPRPREKRWSRAWRMIRPGVKVIFAGFVSWAFRQVAARVSGQVEQFGIRVQRKLKREGERVPVRLTAAGAGDHRG